MNLRISGGPGAIRTGRFFQSVGSFRPAPARNQGRNAAPLVSSPLALSRYNLEPQRGFEPLTCRLQIDCASFAPQGHPTLSTAPALLYSRNGPANVGPFQHRVTSANYSQPGAAASIETRCTKSGIRTNGSVVAEGDPAAECRLRAQGHSIVGNSPRPRGLGAWGIFNAEGAEITQRSQSFFISSLWSLRSLCLNRNLRALCALSAPSA